MDQLAIPYPVTDANDDPVSGALLYVYRTGTTTLSTDIYQDDDASAAHVNPVVCDSAGRPPQVFFNGGYAVRVRATTPAGATIFDHDPVPRVSSSTAAASAISFVPMATNSATNVQAAIQNAQEEIDGYALSAGKMAGGSVAEPGLAFVGDENTGFYRPAADQVALSEGGVDQGRLYGRKNILGLVSQVSGIPTGALWETGSNANGIYARSADGMQIAISPQFTANSTTAQGALFRTPIQTWNLPVAFTGGSTGEYSSGFLTPGNAASVFSVTLRPISSTSAETVAWTASSEVSRSWRVSLTGRWF